MKKIILYLSFFIMLFVPSPSVEAASAISIKFEYGFDGEVQSYRGFPLKVIVKNMGEEFSGDLLIQSNLEYSVTTSTKLDLDLLANSEATYTVYIPGIMANNYSIYNDPEIILYEGNIEDGKRVSFTGPTKLTPKYVNPSFVLAGALTTNLERIDTELKFTGLTDTYELNNRNFPESPIGLEMFNVIYVDDIPLDTLNSLQMSSLMDWIEKGGTLISSALANQKVDIVPLTIHSTKQVTNLLYENEYSEQTMTYYDAEVKEGAVIVSNNNGIIHAKRQIGAGTVSQFNFSLGDAPITQWEKYNGWFKNELKLAEINPLKNPYSSSLIANGGSILNDITSKFKAINLSFAALSIILFIYIIAVTLGVYLLLKRKRKLEYAWGVIPLVALISSIIIFAIGANSRFLVSNMNQMAVYVNDQGQLTGVLSTNLLSNRGGKVSLRLDENAPVYFYDSNYYRNGLSERGTKVVNQGIDNVLIDYYDVDYWGTVSATALVTKESVGELKSDLTVNNLNLIGTITNTYDFDFEKIGIWIGQDWYELEGILSQETIEVNITLNSDLIVQPQYLDYYYGNERDMNEMKVSAMKSYYPILLSSKNYSIAGPAIVGQTKEQIHSFELENGRVTKDHSAFILQSLIIEMEVSGEVVISTNQINKNIMVVDGNLSYVENNSTWFVPEKGTYEVVYSLPISMRNKSILLNKVEVNYYDHYRWADYYLEDVVTGKRILLEDYWENDGSYTVINDNQLKLIIVIEKNSNGDGLAVPELLLHMEVQ